MTNSAKHVNPDYLSGMDDDEAYQIVFGKVLAGLRERAGMSQLDLAAAAGITQGTLSRIESGKLAPDVNTSRRLAAALALSHHEFVDLVGKAHEKAQRFAKQVGATTNSDEWFERVLGFAGAAGLGALIGLAVAALLTQLASEAAAQSKKAGGSKAR